MPLFGDMFTYGYSYELVGGRRFYNCTLVKDVCTKKSRQHFNNIFIDPPNHIWFDGDERCIFKFKRISLKQIQSEVFDMYIKDLNLLNFELSKRIEDKHGTFIEYRMHMYIDQYMRILFGEFLKSALVIKYHWKRVVSDPSYKMCRNRLMREFNALKNLCD